MINVPFKSVGRDGYLLNSEFAAKGMTASDDSATSDQLQYWDAETSGYDIFWYYEGDSSEAEYPEGWYNFTTGEKFEKDYPDGFMPGTPFWYLSIGDAELSATDLGAVPEEASYTFPIVKGNFNMVGSPYPGCFSLNNKITVLNGTLSDDSATSDQMQFWNPATSGYELFWYFEGDPSDEAYPAGWYSFESGEKFEADYPKGFTSTKPCWYFALGIGTGSITFAKPY